MNTYHCSIQQESVLLLFLKPEQQKLVTFDNSYPSIMLVG